MSKDNGGHWYDPRTGQAVHWVPRKDGKGTRPTTLKDARERGLYPGVTSILKVLDKPALVEWKVRQAVMAVCTAPDVPGEALDAKITRILDTEQQQDQEARQAADRGTAMHDAMQLLFEGKPDKVSPELLPWIRPAYEAAKKYGPAVDTETVVIGPGYGGRLDLIQAGGEDTLWIRDFKTSRKLPERGAWPEHRIQLAAYAHAVSLQAHYNEIRTSNVYISAVDPGKFVICDHEEHWLDVYEQCFEPLKKVWCWVNNFWPGKSQELPKGLL